MVVVSIETIGEERFIRGFNRIKKQIVDMRPVFEKIATYFWAREKQIFAREGDPEGFKPLSAAYKAWKQKHFPGRKIMQLTERLRNSLIGEKQAVAQDTIKIVKKKSAEFGTQVPYTHRHQMGTFGMPQRKIVQLTEKDKMWWAKTIHEWAYKTVLKEVG